MDAFIFFLIGAVIIYLSVLTYYYLRLKKNYDKLIGLSEKESLTDILETILTKWELEKKEVEKLRKTIEEQLHQGEFHMQKAAILRFNPFSDTGGDQSFVMALLDGRDNGLVFTSLTNRGSSRWYAKNVVKGKGADYDLSQEEDKAIRMAQKKGREIIHE